MPIAKGHRSELLVSEEADLGVAGPSPYTDIAYISESLAGSFSQVSSQPIRNERPTKNVRHGNESIGGSIESYFTFSPSCLLLWKHAFWATRSAGTIINPTILAINTDIVRGEFYVSSGYTYVCIESGNTGGTITVAPLDFVQTQGTAQLLLTGFAADAIQFETYTSSDVLPGGGLTIEKAVKGSSSPFFYQMRGNRLAELTLRCVAGSALTISSRLMGLAASSSATQFAASISPSVAPYPLFLGSDTAILISGVLKSRPVSNITLTVNNNYAERYDVTAQARKGLRPGSRSLTGAISIYFEDDFEYQSFATEVERSLTLSCIRGAESVKLTLPRVRFVERGVPTIVGPGVVSVEYSFTALSDSGAGDVVLTQTIPLVGDRILVNQNANPYADESGNNYRMI